MDYTTACLDQLTRELCYFASVIDLVTSFRYYLSYIGVRHGHTHLLVGGYRLIKISHLRV